jgi:uncharacterized protein (DUF58 family)
MKSPHARWPLQVFRILSVSVPSAVAWNVASASRDPSALDDAVHYGLGPLWLATASALIVRAAGAIRGRPEGVSFLDRVDVLTASGCTLSWLGSLAIMASVWVGWASLSVVGLMGLTVLHLVVLWTVARAGGNDPWRRASLARRFVPEGAVEGDPVTEQLALSDACIPTGFRLFASGRVGPRWPLTRYAVTDVESQGEIVLESDLGPALRGDHQAEPLEVWLQDVLGLCRSIRVRAGAARLTVVPKARPVEGARPLIGKPGEDREPKATNHLPTEGSLHLREYQPGDDARRIHWVRSLAAQQIVVRLPDERPPTQPAAQIVLDTFLPGVESLSCASPAELLDALVSVWLGVGRALAEAGVRVTLVTAGLASGARTGAPSGNAEVGPIRCRLAPRTMGPALRLGAEVRWQDALEVVGLLDDAPAIVVSYRQSPDLGEGKQGVRWIVVPQTAWTRFDEPAQTLSVGLLPHPVGSPENRWSRRRRDRLRRERARRDHLTFARLCKETVARSPGTFVATPARKGAIHLEAVQ